MARISRKNVYRRFTKAFADTELLSALHLEIWNRRVRGSRSPISVLARPYAPIDIFLAYLVVLLPYSSTYF